jgi:hypothetical protein
MTPNAPNPASAGTLARFEDTLLGSEQSPDSAPAQKYQARNSRGIPLRENGCPGHNPGQPITWPFLAKKGPNSETNNKANRVRPQDVLDCPRHGFLVVLSRAVRGRSIGACFRAAEKQRRLERVAPRGTDEQKATKGSCHGLKSRRGPSSRRPPQRRRRLSVQGGRDGQAIN